MKKYLYYPYTIMALLSATTLGIIMIINLDYSYIF
jgi:hypothetical protein